MPIGLARPQGPGADPTGLEPEAEPQQATSLPGSVWLVAAIFVAVELSVSARYGFHRDELYFIAGGRRPAFGYVDQPPIAPLLTRLGTIVFGTSPTAVRVIPALVGGGVVVGTAATARTLGGGRFAQVLAALAMACAPITLGASHLAGTTVYDLAAWTFTMLFVLRAVVLERPRNWLAAGAVAGIGLEGKNLILLLAVALVIGLLSTSTRSVLATRWPWFGALIATVLWAPNVVWQFANDFPSVAMARSLRVEHSAAGDYVAFLPGQVILVGIFAFPIVVIGIRHLARRRDLHFALVAVAVVVAYVFAVIPGRQYYTAGMLPVVLAVGACRIEERRPDRSRRRLWMTALVIGGILSLAFVLPVLPLSTFARFAFFHKTSYDLGETVGWPQLTGQVAKVYGDLPGPERRSASIFTANYGEAGAIGLYGGAYGLPAPLSGHNNYWLWGPGRASDQVVIAVGSADQLRPHFASCRYASTFHSPDDVDNDENGTVLSICTGPKGTWSSLWGSLRNYG